MKFQTLAQIIVYKNTKYKATIYCADKDKLTSFVYDLFEESVSVHNTEIHANTCVCLTKDLDYVVVSDSEATTKEIILILERSASRLTLDQALDQATAMNELFYVLSYARERIFNYDTYFTTEDCEKLVEHITSDCDDYFTV